MSSKREEERKRLGVADADFTVVDHTADWAVTVRGRDLRHLLLSAAWAMNSLLVAEPNTVPLEVEREIAVEGFDRESILVEWLSELAYLAEKEGLVCREFELQEVTTDEVRALVRGGRAEQLQKHIKAVTYHNLEVIESDSGLEATVVFDV